MTKGFEKVVEYIKGNYKPSLKSMSIPHVKREIFEATLISVDVAKILKASRKAFRVKPRTINDLIKLERTQPFSPALPQHNRNSDEDQEEEERIRKRRRTCNDKETDNGVTEDEVVSDALESLFDGLRFAVDLCIKQDDIQVIKRCGGEVVFPFSHPDIFVTTSSGFHSSAVAQMQNRKIPCVSLDYVKDSIQNIDPEIQPQHLLHQTKRIVVGQKDPVKRKALEEKREKARERKRKQEEKARKRIERQVRSELRQK